MTLPAAAASRAVLIGVSTYANLEDLPSVADNRRGMTELLTGPGSWGLAPEHCVVLADPESSVRVLDAVSAAAEEATDALFVYFAGHGLVSPQGNLHLGLPNTDLDRLWDSVDYSQLRPVIHESRAPRRVVVLDCCYGGLAMGGHMGADQSLADLTGIDGAYLMTASAATRRAMAPKNERYTAFTGELLKAAVDGIPEGPEILDMGTLFLHVRRELRAKDRPVPQQWARDLGQRIALARNGRAPGRGPAAEAYATALRSVVEEAGAKGARLTADDPVAGSYLRGWHVAPREFVESLPAHGIRLTAAEAARLHTLRRDAQRVARDTEDRLLYWQEEVELLRRQLEHAGGYSRTIETELADAREQVRRLGREVRVLQRQVGRLETKPPPARTEALVEVPAAAAGPGGAPSGEPTGGGEGTTGGTATAAERVSASGRALAVLGVVAALYTVIMWLFSLGEVALVHDGGRKPASAGFEGGSGLTSTLGPRYVWDVGDDLASTFRPEDDDATDRLLGSLGASVPRGCEDRTIVWELTVDGERADHGSLTGKSQHYVPVELPLQHTASEVGIEASWDGGTGSCQSFGLVWNQPRLSESFEPLPW